MNLYFDWIEAIIYQRYTNKTLIFRTKADIIRTARKTWLRIRGIKDDKPWWCSICDKKEKK